MKTQHTDHEGFERVLERYLDVFGLKISDLEEKEDTNGRPFYFLDAWKVAFFPLDDTASKEFVQLRINDELNSQEDSDVRTYFLPYNIEQETKAAGYLFF